MYVTQDLLHIRHYRHSTALDYLTGTNPSAVLFAAVWEPRSLGAFFRYHCSIFARNFDRL